MAYNSVSILANCLNHRLEAVYKVEGMSRTKDGDFVITLYNVFTTDNIEMYLGGAWRNLFDLELLTQNVKLYAPCCGLSYKTSTVYYDNRRVKISLFLYAVQ